MKSTFGYITRNNERERRFSSVRYWYKISKQYPHYIGWKHTSEANKRHLKVMLTEKTPNADLMSFGAMPLGRFCVRPLRSLFLVISERMSADLQCFRLCGTGPGRRLEAKEGQKEDSRHADGARTISNLPPCPPVDARE